jgi:hypothetical protein
LGQQFTFTTSIEFSPPYRPALRSRKLTDVLGRRRQLTLLFTAFALACDPPGGTHTLASISTLQDAGGNHASAVGPFDAGLDAGAFDAGAFDAGTLDSGTDDAGTYDAGMDDAGQEVPDAGAPIDGGSFDGGPACIPGPAPDLTSVAYYANGAYYGALASADLDGDGLLDLVAANTYTAAAIAVFFGQADGGLSDPTVYSTDAGVDFFASVAIGDLNGDGLPDVVAGSFYSSQVAVYYNLGNGVLSEASIYAVANAVLDIAIGDLNGDGLPDLILAEDFGSGEELLNVGDGSFASPVSLPQMLWATTVVVADFNNDGLADIAFASTIEATPVAVLTNEGDGGFEMTTYPLTSDGPAYTAVGLIPRVGSAPDLVNAGWLSPDSGVVELMPNAGGIFGSGESYPIPNAPGVIVGGDVNGDCIPDVLVAGWCGGCGPPTGGFVIFLPGYSDGGFGPPTQLSSSTSPGGVAFLGPVGSPRAVAVANGSSDAGLTVFGDPSKH